jgi:hypothetical protein
MSFLAGVPMDASSMNWASFVFFGGLLGTAVHFGVRAKETYCGPVVEVQGYVECHLSSSLGHIRGASTANDTEYYAGMYKSEMVSPHWLTKAHASL